MDNVSASMKHRGTEIKLQILRHLSLNYILSIIATVAIVYLYCMGQLINFMYSITIIGIRSQTVKIFVSIYFKNYNFNEAKNFVW